MTKTSKDPVREFLQQRGCTEHVVRGGMQWLLKQWHHIAQSVAAGYRLGIDDYLNDMDTRQLIEEALLVASPPDRDAAIKQLSAADELMKKSVTSREHCLWGDINAKERGWSPKKNWWYYSQPVLPGKELKKDIEI